MFKQKMSKVAAVLRPWYGLIGEIVFLLLAVFILFVVVFGLKRMPNIAMSPIVNEGDLVMYSKLGNEYAENDVVLYEKDGKSALSRIIAKEGQLVDVNNEGYITVDNVVVSKMPVTDNIEAAAQEMGLPYRVSGGMFYLLNDNYELKDDSRSFGAVYLKEFKGKVITVLKVRGI